MVVASVRTVIAGFFEHFHHKADAIADTACEAVAGLIVGEEVFVVYDVEESFSLPVVEVFF